MTLPMLDGLPDCILCAVRTLTEGRPENWVGATDREPGATITGVVLKVGVLDYLPVPDRGDREPALYVDVWTGTERLRIAGIAMTLHSTLKRLAPTVGDQLTIRFDRWETIQGSKRPEWNGTQYRVFTGSVTRGHHAV